MFEACFSSRGILQIVVRLRVIVKPRSRGSPGPVGAVMPWEKSGTVLLKELIVTSPENKRPFNGICFR